MRASVRSLSWRGLPLLSSTSGRSCCRASARRVQCLDHQCALIGCEAGRQQQTAIIVPAVAQHAVVVAMGSRLAFVVGNVGDQSVELLVVDIIQTHVVRLGTQGLL